jgi:hypothetical protein
MQAVNIRIAKEHHVLLLGEKQREIWNQTKVLLELPLNNEPSDIITLSGNTNQLPIAMDRIVKEISSKAAEPHTITLRNDTFRIEPLSAVKNRERNMDENERLKEKKGRGEEVVSDSDSDSESDDELQQIINEINSLQNQ